MTLESPPENQEVEVEIVVETIEVQVEEGLSNKGPPLPIDAEEPTPLFVIDTQGDLPVSTGIPAPTVRAVSPTPSDSSEEIILFTGRNKTNKPRVVESRKKASRPAMTIIDPIDEKIKLVEDKICQQRKLLEEMIHPKDNSVKPHPKPASPSYNEFEAILPKEKGHSRRRGRNRVAEQEEEDALIADYMANMDDNDNLLGNISFNQRELGGTSDGLWVDETEVSSGEALQHSTSNNLGEWDRSELIDFDDLATSDGVLGELAAIYSKRERPSGVQYLVVSEGQTADEARWVNRSVLTTMGALAYIQDFEADKKLMAEFQDNDQDDSTSSDNMDINNDDDGNNDQELMQRKIDRMTDESIARLLAKQEELGMGSSELLLFDDAADGDAEDVSALMAAWKTVNKKNKKSPKNARGKQPSNEFPAASALADAYDGFDVMDFDRPSLKKKPKGRKGVPEFDISDSDLEASMQEAWTNDRSKKKARKQEREESRAAGLIGSKNGKPDLKQKYKEGMGFDDVSEEIKSFLGRGDSTYV